MIQVLSGYKLYFKNFVRNGFQTESFSRKEVFQKKKI